MIEREPDPDNRRSVTVTLTDRGRKLVQAARPAYEERAKRLAAGLPEDPARGREQAVDAWLAFFEPDERVAPRLGIAVATAAVAKRMRSAVGLPEEPGVIVLRVGRDSAAESGGVSARRPDHAGGIEPGPFDRGPRPLGPRGQRNAGFEGAAWRRRPRAGGDAGLVQNDSQRDDQQAEEGAERAL